MLIGHGKLGYERQSSFRTGGLVLSILYIFGCEAPSAFIWSTPRSCASIKILENFALKTMDTAHQTQPPNPDPVKQDTLDTSEVHPQSSQKEAKSCWELAVKVNNTSYSFNIKHMVYLPCLAPL
jgi:hypothetical protein